MRKNYSRCVLTWVFMSPFSCFSWGWTVTPPATRSSSTLLPRAIGSSDVESLLTPQHRSCRPIRPSSPYISSTRLYEKKSSVDDDQKKNPDDEEGEFGLMNLYGSKIPNSLKDEIFAAEAKTPAAQDRSTRVALYGLVFVVGILAAFFNAFVSELRTGGASPEEAIPLADIGFGWVESNPVFHFFFLNKIGGGIFLLGGAGAGLLAEAELDTQRINSEKIYDEMVRRRKAKEAGGGQKRRKKKQVSKKMRRNAKELKRMQALSEVMNESREQEEAAANTEPTPAVEEASTDKQEEKQESLMGKMKGFYEKADQMAASQALLLNKSLEDAGVVDKITDESGLKVIGKEEAAKQKLQKDNKNKKKKE